MCGRFCNATTPSEVIATFKVHFSTRRDNEASQRGGFRGHNAEPQWNIAPSLEVECITASLEPNKNTPKNTLGLMRWGIATPQNTRPLINARSETMFEKSTYREAAQRRRCIVIASGWYEWSGPKKPYYISRVDDAPMGMAGLYWQHEDERNCVIVTTEAEGSLSALHHRAPLVLDGDALACWLNPEMRQDDVMPVIKPTAAATFSWHPISVEVGSTRVSHDGLIKPDPYHGAKPEPQLNLF